MKVVISILLKSFLYIFTISLLATVIGLIYLTGLVRGYNFGKSDAEIKFITDLIKSDISSKDAIELVNDKIASAREISVKLPSPTTIPSPVPKINWGGPELWNLVNKRRVELGVNALKQKNELCTIASIRLNELLELGKLDGHEGFGNLKDRRKDLAWIFDEYSAVAEFLATGGVTALETVNMWEDTLAHKKIVDGGEFVWGCIYAQDTFSVGITAY